MRQTLDIDRLIAELSSPDPLQRETAVARLALAAGRAVPRLLAIAGDAQAPPARGSRPSQALEASPETRGVVAAAVAVQRDPDDELALAAIGVLAHATHGRGTPAASALDCLTGLALDASATVPRRLAALAALDGLPERHVRPVYDALRADPASRVVARVIRHQAGLMLPLDELLERGLPDDPALVGAVVREDGDRATLGVLGRLIEAASRQGTPGPRSAPGRVARRPRAGAPGIGRSRQPPGALRPSGDARETGHAASGRIPGGRRGSRRRHLPRCGGERMVGGRTGGALVARSPRARPSARSFAARASPASTRSCARCCSGRRARARWWPWLGSPS